MVGKSIRLNIPEEKRGEGSVHHGSLEMAYWPEKLDGQGTPDVGPVR
jgi:hypothetical protein